MCPHECASGKGAHEAGAQSPYQIWLSTKVLRAVERALQHEGQKILEDYVVSKKWVLPPLCKERRLVTTKIHSLLLQWRPDFSAEWSLKLRRALPILEILFSHIASSKEEFSNPLLIEPHLKGVLSLLDSDKSCPLWPSTIHCQCHRVCVAKYTEESEKVCACKSCLHVIEGRCQPNKQEACVSRSCPSVDKGRMDVKGHEAFASPNLDEETNLSKKTQRANSCLFNSCSHLEERLNTTPQNALVSGSSLYVADDLAEENLDDSLEWSKANLPSKGTVATLMVSELRSSRKEEANQALWNALASREVALLEDNLEKHGEFASKWILKKVVTMLKRSKKKEKLRRDRKKVVAEQLPHVAAEKKKMRILSKGLFGLFSCHSAASEHNGLPADPSPSPIELEALESVYPCCLVCRHPKHVGGHAQKDDVIQEEAPISCSSNMVSCSASLRQTSTDGDSDDDNNDGSWHSIHNHIKSIHYKSYNEMPVSLVSKYTIINGSEKSTGSSPKDSDDGHNEVLSGDVTACHQNVQGDITARALSSGYGCIDMQLDLVQSNQGSSDIDSVDEDFGHTYNHHTNFSSMVSCSHDGDSESHGRSSFISHNDNDGIGPLPCSSVTNDPLRGKERACLTSQNENDSSYNERREEGYMLEEADTGVKGRREDTPNGLLLLDDAHRVDANVQTGSLYKDGKRHKEDMATRSNMLHGNEDVSHVVEASTDVGVTQRRDVKRQEECGAAKQRARVPLSSYLTEKEDWSVQNTKSWIAWQGTCSWDTWEEPIEALDPLCCVCMTGLKGAAFTPCGHTFCRKCSRELWNGRGTCPLCNKVITGILDIF